MLGGSGDPSSVLGRIGSAVRMGRLVVRTMRADFDTSAMRDVPMDRIAEAEETAGAVAFLCSSDASYVTGVTIPVDGGQAAD